MKTTAQDIMSTELITLDQNATIEEALKVLMNSRITGLPITDKANKMIGVLSEYDILQQIAKYKKLDPKIFKERITFSKDAMTVKTTTPLEDIVELFIEHKYRRLPVVEKDGKLAGIITRRDLMRIFFYRSRLT